MQLLSPIDCHGRPLVGMKGYFVAFLQMLIHRFADEVLRVPCRFRFRDHPAHDVTAEKIQREVEIVPLSVIVSLQTRASSPEGLHLQALAEPDVNLSAHPAPILQPLGLVSNFQCGKRPGFVFATANCHLPALVL